MLGANLHFVLIRFRLFFFFFLTQRNLIQGSCDVPGSCALLAKIRNHQINKKPKRKKSAVSEDRVHLVKTYHDQKDSAEKQVTGFEIGKRPGGALL